MTPTRDESAAAAVEFPASTASTASTAAASQALAISRKYAALSAGHRRQFRDKARAQGIDPARLPIVPIADCADGYPLSPAQERLWFLWKLDPDSPAYHLARTMRLTGALDVPALRRAFDALVARHGALRMRFVETRGVPSQRLARDAAEVTYGWRELALDAAAQLPGVLQAAAREPFDLGSGPLLRVMLVGLGGDAHVLQIVTHHIVSDGWSQAVMVRELVALYRAALAGDDTAGVLPPLELHCGDVAAWQREWQSSDDDLGYWVERLGGDAPLLELPLDRPRGTNRGVEGGRCRAELDPTLAARLRELAHARRTTLFTLLFSAYAALLYRYGGQRRVRIGVPSAGRERRETDGLIGYFVNTLVIEAEVDGAMPFDALLGTVQTRVLEAQAHQDVPFGRVLDALQVPREAGRSPLFQVMFNLEQADASEAAAALPGVVVETVDGGTGTVRFDLVLNAVEDRRGLKLTFNYAADVFDAATVERLSAHYVEVLEQLAASDGTRRVGELTLSTGREAAPARRYAFESLGQALSA
ncbi:condensation domain-containing protein, partial [Paraburkholderia phosphatilytica]|uniref:condensation domain-containing protein n=1 Tax=Paraburkholderia phosphatilytica TaxID=2282883 RepID=UPI001F0C00AC